MSSEFNNRTYPFFVLYSLLADEEKMLWAKNRELFRFGVFRWRRWQKGGIISPKPLTTTLFASVVKSGRNITDKTAVQCDAEERKNSLSFIFVVVEYSIFFHRTLSRRPDLMFYSYIAIQLQLASSSEEVSLTQNINSVNLSR